MFWFGIPNCVDDITIDPLTDDENGVFKLALAGHNSYGVSKLHKYNKFSYTSDFYGIEKE